MISLPQSRKQPLEITPWHIKSSLRTVSKRPVDMMSRYKAVSGKRTVAQGSTKACTRSRAIHKSRLCIQAYNLFFEAVMLAKHPSLSLYMVS